MPRQTFPIFALLGFVALAAQIQDAGAQATGNQDQHAQDAEDAGPDVPVVADPADIAFEEGRWQDAIAEYRAILDQSPEDRLSLLRIAQAQRELGRHDDAVETLEEARTMNAPEAMVDFERSRNLLALGRRDDGLAAL